MTLGLITEIVEFEGEKLPDDDYTTYSGFRIKTEYDVVTLAIADQQSCCEIFGYFLTEDDPSKFIGQWLTAIKITDTNRSSKKFDYDSDWKGDDDGTICLESGDVLFVDIETELGSMQFVAYNAHNGYYGHEAVVISKRLNHRVGI